MLRGRALWLAVSCVGLIGVPTLVSEPVLRLLSGGQGETNLLRNPGFELVQNGGFVAWQRAPQGWRVASGEGRLNSQALACSAPDASGWYGASQTLTLNQSEPVPIVVRGWSRAEEVSGGSDSDYSLYVDIIYRDGTPLWGQTANFSTGTHDWQLRQAVIMPQKPVRSLTVHCLFRKHSGKAWFDDVEVSELTVPSGAVMFQGVPMAKSRWTNPPAINPVIRSTSDGLSLTLDGGRVTSLSVDGRELASGAPAGFLARDVAANSDVHAFANQECPELGLRLVLTAKAETNHIAIEGRVSSTSTNDRSILLLFALPAEAVGWTWHDDIRRSRSIVGGGGEYQNVTTVGCGTTGTLSVYPMACIEDGRSGLAMAIDMAQPAQYRLLYHAGTGQFLIAYDFGLVRDTVRFPSAADFRFVIYRFEPKWGFRAAWEKLMTIFPEYFVVRSVQQGIWMPFTDVSTVQGWEDFGFRYHEGNNNVPFDDAHGILSFRYTEPMTWWMSMAPELPRTLAAAFEVRDALAAGPTGFQRSMAEVSRSAAMFDEEGNPALLFRDTPWANGAVWSLNPNPFLPSAPNAATIYWNDSIRDRLYGPGANGHLDGEYLDSLEGYVTANLNFRREHFAHTTVPLTFSMESRQPALFKGLAVFEFTKWISSDLHNIGKLCFANGVPYRFSFLCPWLDVMGTETDWLSGDQYRPVDHATMSLWRTMSGRKPYLLLMNTEFDKFGPDLVERYFQRALFYGMYPSMFSHNAADNPYWRNPAWYNRDRALFRRYIPIIRQVAEAGWQPVTGAVCDRQEVMVERFGPAADGTTYFTLLNESTNATTACLTLAGRSPEEQDRFAATELLSNEWLTRATNGWPVHLAPGGTAVLRLQPPARFSGATVESTGRFRMIVQAPDNQKSSVCLRLLW